MSNSPSPEPAQQPPTKRAKTGRNNPRARLVCLTCRQRKVKCDAETIPAGTKCAPCRASNAECSINWNDDRRKRNGATYLRMAEMQQRINGLESLIRNNSAQMNTDFQNNSACYEAQTQDTVQVQPPTQNGIITPPQSQMGVATLGTTTHEELGTTIVTSEDAPVNLSRQSPPPSDTWNPGSSGAKIPESTSHSSVATRNPWRQRPSIALSSHAHEALPCGLNTVQREPDGTELASVSEPTIPSIALPQTQHESGNGDLRFFGSTTQPHINSAVEKASQDPEDDECGLDRSLNMDSMQLRKAILKNFFEVQPHAQIVVREDMFTTGKLKGERSRHYSPFLENSMLASGTRYSTSSAVRALGKRYAERAKSLISSEIDDANIATLQGFLLLSDFEATRGCAKVGWTYCVIAGGLIVDLGLHIDYSHLVREGKMSVAEQESRDGVLLATYVYSTLWNLYLGRPNPFSPSIVAAARRVTAIKTPETETMHVWVGLCIQMFEIIEILNRPSADGSMNRDTLLRLWELDNRLRTFFNNLPTHLKYNESTIEELDASAYGLQMQFSGIQITLHLAMIKSDHIARGFESKDGVTKHRATDQLYEIVNENVLRICQLVLSYRRVFGVEKIITVMLDNMFVAAIALISLIPRNQRQGKPVEKDIRWLKMIFNTFEVVGKHYPVTARMISTLTRIMATTPLAMLFPVSSVPTPASNTESMTGIFQDPLAFTKNGEISLNVHDPSYTSMGSEGFDFMFTDEENTLIHGSGWNIASWSLDSADESLLMP